MKKKHISLLSIAFLLIASFVYYKHAFPSYTINYRITINVDTPEGIKSGSAVRGYYYSRALFRGPHWGDTRKSIGEAVVIDLGDKGTLFGLIAWDSYRELTQSLPVTQDIAIGTKAEVSSKRYWPKMVMYEVPRDPETIETIFRGHQSQIVDHAKSILGDDYEITSVQIEITDEPVTWGSIDRHIPLFKPDENYSTTFYNFKKR